jgi:hypothetical protein
MAGAAPSAPPVPRGWRPTRQYVAAAALLSIMAVTAAVLVSRDDSDSLGHGASVPPPVSVDVSTPSDSARSGAAGPTAIPPPANPPAANARKVTAATSTTKGISVRDSDTRLDPATGRTAAAAVGGEVPPPGPQPASLVTIARVVHQHRLGGCRGVLKASAQGLAFEPEGPESKDAFIFAYRDFVHQLDGETLVLKTSDRTFRFQPIENDGKRDSGELSALLATLRAAR